MKNIRNDDMKNREGNSYLPVFAGGGAFRLISSKALRFALAFLCFSFAFSSYAVDIFVAPEGRGAMTGADWSNALNGSLDGYHIDVKTAITDAVANGATEVNVYFAGGTYSVTNQLSLSSITIPVKLSGGYLAETDGSLDKGETATTFSRTANNVRHISAASLTSFRIEGITFSGGYISATGTKNSHTALGAKGGAVASAASTTVISNCVFRNNVFQNVAKDSRSAYASFLGGGGAVAAITSGRLDLDNCVFVGNRHDAAGTYNQSSGGAVLAYNVTFNALNCTFEDNYMNGESGRNTLFGAAIGTYYGNVSISNCTFSGNYILGATSSPGGAAGGALAIRDAVSFKMADSVFTGNYVASTSGTTFPFSAGIMLLDDWKASDGLAKSVVERCIFDSRTAPSTAADSRKAQSDILLSGGQLFMTNCLVFAAKGNSEYGGYSVRNLGTLSYNGNTTKYYGYVYSSVICAQSDMELVNCTIADGKTYGVAAVDDAASLSLKNCIVYGNGEAGVVDATSIDHCCLQEEHEGEGNFVPASKEALNWTGAPYYHLLTKKSNGAITNGWFSGTFESKRTAADSPCIDAGSAGFPVGLEPEPNGRRVNLGAYGGTQWASMTSGAIGLVMVVK